MLKIEYLTELETLRIDPTGKATEHYKKMKASSSGPKGYTTLETSDISKYLNVLQSKYPLHSDYWDMNRDALSKCGPQGLMISYEELLDIVKLYYEVPTVALNAGRLVRLGRDYLLKLLKEKLESVGIPEYDIPTVYERTSASLPTMGKKGSFLSETVCNKQWHHPLPNVAGQRYMRNAPRAIFMDPVSNVRYIEKTLKRVKRYLTRVLPDWFSGWINPDLVLSPLATKFVDRRATFLETDYVKMDRHFTWEVVQEFILPIYELLSPMDYLSFASFVEESFSQPIYVGFNRMFTGPHTLLSGQGPTNDFETLYTIEWLIGAVLEYSDFNHAMLLAQGDDATLGLLNVSLSRMRDIANRIIDESNQLGLVMHPLDDPKTNLRQGKFAFCRKLYYPRGRRNTTGALIGAYPSVLCANNIITPERMPINASVAAISDLQRCDGVVGSIDYYDFVQWVFKHSTHKFRNELIQSEDAVNYVNDRDWWQKIYGERWDPASSPTYKFIASMRPKL